MQKRSSASEKWTWEGAECGRRVKSCLPLHLAFSSSAKPSLLRSVLNLPAVKVICANASAIDTKNLDTETHEGKGWVGATLSENTYIQIFTWHILPFYYKNSF